MKELKLSDPADCLYFLIYRASLLSTNTLKRELSGRGLEAVRPAYIGALMSLWYEDRFNEAVNRLGAREGMRLSELGRRAGLEPSTMTGLVDRMERDGLVMRVNDPDDRRAQLVTLTEKGRSMQRAVMESVDDSLDRMFEGIPQADRERLKRLLGRVLANVRGRGGD